MLSEKQKDVLKGIVIGLLLTIGIIVVGILFNPFGYSKNMGVAERLVIVGQCMSLLAIGLGVSIGRLAKQRFFNEEDIDGGGLTKGSQKAKVLQSVLQNTLEQSILAAMVYIIWAVTMPSQWMSVVVLSAMLFFLGRVAFIIGYEHGAGARALGFAMDFYPSMANVNRFNTNAVANDDLIKKTESFIAIFR